jgi:hypothetical protein
VLTVLTSAALPLDTRIRKTVQDTLSKFTSTEAIEESINQINSALDKVRSDRVEVPKRRRKSRKPMSMSTNSPSKVDADESVLDLGEVKDVITLIEGSRA